MAVEIRHSGETVTVVSKRGVVTVRAPSYRVDVASGMLLGGIPYTGEYEVTPSDEAQVLETSGLMMTENVTIAPIPDNYGRIAWNGSGILVY